MVKDYKYSTISKMLSSWELARQKYGSDEEVGTEIMLALFELDPTIKVVFGFRVDQNNIHTNPLLRMGVLVHAKHIMQMLDCVLSMLGPDTDTLSEVLKDVGRRHVRRGVRKEHVPLLIVAIQKTLKEIIGEDEWTKEIQDGWQDVFDDLSAEIVSCM
jgi:hemoglobin-like flavoprotein